MSTGFVYLRPLPVVCVRTLGPYARSSLQAWNQMFSWLDDSGMRREIGCGYGLMRDDPHSVPPEQCRYEACVELIAGFERSVPAGFHIHRLPGGAYARRRAVGTPTMGAVFGELSDGWVPAQGLEVDTRRPFIEVYLDDPLLVPAEQRRMDICIPVAATLARPREQSAA